MDLGIQQLLMTAFSGAQTLALGVLVFQFKSLEKRMERVEGVFFPTDKREKRERRTKRLDREARARNDYGE